VGVGQVEPGETVASTSSLLERCLITFTGCAGETVVESQGRFCTMSSVRWADFNVSLKEDAGRGLLGEMRLLRHASQGTWRSFQ
jgi:hypothetical protein